MRAVSRIVVAAGLLLLAGCGSAHLAAGGTPTPTATNSVVRWIDAPASEYVEPVDTGEPPAYRACSGRDLVVAPATAGAALGTAVMDVAVTNRGSVPCTLSGAPTAVLGTGDDGTRRRMGRFEKVGYVNMGPGAANLRPGDQARIAFWWEDACPALIAGHHDNVRLLTVELLGGGALKVPLVDSRGQGWDLGCGLHYDAFGPSRTAPPPDPAESSPLDVLTAASDPPAQVTAGQVVHFHVTLHNGSDAPVRLDPCPSYGMWVGVPLPGTATSYYQLNCAAAPVVPAHGSVTFAMQYAVGDATGPGKFGWFVQRATVGVGREVTVVPAGS